MLPGVRSAWVDDVKANIEGNHPIAWLVVVLCYKLIGYEFESR
jgi:hypothetical protein